MERDKQEDMGGRSEGKVRESGSGVQSRRKEGAGVNSTWI